MTMQVTPLTGVIGAEVTGLDLASPLDVTATEALRDALCEHLVLVLRNQKISPDQHVAFGRCFGSIKIPPVPTNHGGPAEVNVLSQVSPKGEGADDWHADNTYTSSPPSISILTVREAPTAGGDTMFASMHAAYERLSEPMRRFCDGLDATHDVSKSMRKAIERGHSDADLSEVQNQLPPVKHPVVIDHPVTGRKALFVNINSTTRIDGLSDEENATVLPLLFAQAHVPELQLRVRWDETTVVVLDNFAVQHYAVPDYDERRVLHRVAVQ